MANHVYLPECLAEDDGYYEDDEYEGYPDEVFDENGEINWERVKEWEKMLKDEADASEYYNRFVLENI